MEVVNALGRRKAAVARVFVSEGNGQITINKRDLNTYFPSPILQLGSAIKETTSCLDQYSMDTTMNKSSSTPNTALISGTPWSTSRSLVTMPAMRRCRTCCSGLFSGAATCPMNTVGARDVTKPLVVCQTGIQPHVAC